MLQIRALISGQYPRLRESLEAYGVQCILTEKDNRLPEPVAYHPDLQFLPVSSNTAFILRGSTLRVPGYRLFETADFPGNVYPSDCLCNGLLLSDIFFAGKYAADTAILNYVKANGFTAVPVAQGYTRCSVCVVTPGALITADPGISKAVRAEGADVLTLNPGVISLPGYGYGFIGGACGKLGNTLYFAGSLHTHPQEQEIRAFTAKYGVSVCSLWEGPLLDVGGIISL